MSCTWLTMDEAAIYLRVHKSTIKRYIRLDKLRASRPGGKLVRICLEDLEKFAEGNDNE